MAEAKVRWASAETLPPESLDDRVKRLTNELGALVPRVEETLDRRSEEQTLARTLNLLVQARYALAEQSAREGLADSDTRDVSAKQDNRQLLATLATLERIVLGVHRLLAFHENRGSNNAPG